MSNNEATFSLKLSNAEIHWLAGAMGFARLPLQLDAKPSEVLAAHSSLAQKHLAVQANGSWQVDRLPAAIVRWLGTAEWMIAVRSHVRGGTTRQLFVFAEQKLGLSAEVEPDIVCFTLFPDLTALTDSLLSWINASFPDREPDSVKYELPQPETVIRAAWRDRKLAEEILKMAGFDSAKSKSTARWLDSIQWTATLSRVRLEAEKPEAQSQVVLCGDSQKSWAGSDVLHPAASKRVRALIQNLL